MTASASLESSPLADGGSLSLGVYMTNPSTSRPTTSHTGRSEPLTLIAWSLQTIEGECRLTVTGGPHRGVCQTHRWRFKPETLTAGLLAEIEAQAALMATGALLGSVGQQGRLPFELDALSWTV